MSNHKKPVWRVLAIVGLLGGVVLLIAAQLPLGSASQMWLLLLWVGLFYGLVAAWIRRNSEALEAEPPAQDSVGRPIIDNGAPVFTVETRRPAPESSIAARPLNQSEAY